jgi:hypothetical protein
VAIIPNSVFLTGVWLNLVIDLRNFFNYLFKGCTYRSIELIEISSVCSLRRILALNNSQVQMIDLMGA